MSETCQDHLSSPVEKVKFVTGRSEQIINNQADTVQGREAICPDNRLKEHDRQVVSRDWEKEKNYTFTNVVIISLYKQKKYTPFRCIKQLSLEVY